MPPSAAQTTPQRTLLRPDRAAEPLLRSLQVVQAPEPRVEPSLRPAGGRPPLSTAAWLLIAVYAGSLFTVYLGSARTFTGHEAFVAQAAREMLATGDWATWLVPRIGGQPWLEKPPLPQWVVATSGLAAGGVTEFVARLPSAILGLVGVFLVTSLACRWFGPTCGLLAGLVQATAVYTLTYARLAEPDVYLWTIVLACLWIFSRQHVEPAAPRRWYASRLMFFILLGMTQLVKGPIFGAVMVLLPCLAFMMIQRSGAMLRWLCWWPGIVTGLAIALAWPAAVLLQYPETAELWWLHTFGRLGDSCLNPAPMWYYLTTLPWQLFPWTIPALVGLVGSLRQAVCERSASDRFLWVWFLGLLVFLSAVKAKHHHYLIYALVPCSVWAGDGLLRIGASVRRWRPQWVAVGVVLALSVLAGGVAWTVEWFPLLANVAPLLGAAMSLVVVLLGWSLACRRPRWAAVTLFTGIWVAHGMIAGEVTPRLDRYAEETALFRRVDAKMSKDMPLLVYGLEPSRLLLYMDTPLEVHTCPEALRDRGRELGQALVLTSTALAEKLDEVGKVTQIDQIPLTSRGPTVQMALYQVRWYAPPAWSDRARSQQLP